MTISPGPNDTSFGGVKEHGFVREESPRANTVTSLKTFQVKICESSVDTATSRRDGVATTVEKERVSS
jgi:hypothetical protein